MTRTLTVLLRPAHGGARPPGGVTAATAAEHAPDPQAAERARGWFAAHGFEAAPLVGAAFAVTAPADLTSATFGEVPDVGELPLDRLPREIAADVEAVVAEPPPDFGPTSW